MNDVGAGPAVLVELVGGPLDGTRLTVPSAWGRLEFHDRSTTPVQSISERLQAGERVPAADVEAEGRITAVYSRTTRARNDARVYEYVAPRRKP